ncbi:MAG: adenylosuccinate lyase [Nitrosopumilaceae archaeon]|nr:adenylosuccinate lyase [Nitrosopumilaceae archaeon]
MAILPIDGGRYGTPEMREVFGDQRKVDHQVRIEGAVAAAQGRLKVIPLRAAQSIARAASPGEVTVARIAELEAKSDHDTAALVEALAEKCTLYARPWIHYGLTSNDLVDTSNSMQMRDALDIIAPKVSELARMLAETALKYADLPAVGRTHGQHASIMSFGLKFANWAEEMAEHGRRLGQTRDRVIICKTLGVVGTGSLMGRAAVDVQREVAEELGMIPAAVATQVVPRERYAEYVFALALIGSTLEKMAVEIRNLQRTEIGEVAERFAEGQMGSSAVPVKRNPIKSERITSLSRLLRSQLGVALENVPLWHERDLSNSANERFIIPTSSIILDEMLQTALGILPRLVINRDRILENMERTRGQIYAEFVMDALIRKGATRMEAYRNVQRVAFRAAKTGAHFRDAISMDGAISGSLDPQDIEKIFDAGSHLGASQEIIRGVAGSIIPAESS